MVPLISMASYHPKKKYLSQQDGPANLVNCSLNASEQTANASSIYSTASSSRVTSLLLSDSQRSLSDNDLKFLSSLGSPAFLGSFCNSGLSLDAIEKLCSEQEAYNSENGENLTAPPNYQHSTSLAASSSSSLLGREFSLDDLALLASASSLHKSYSGDEEQRAAITRDAVEIARDALLPSLPSLSSLSSLSEIDLNAHPSTGSFSSIFNGLDACDQVITPTGSAMKNILTGSDEQEQVRSTALMQDLLTDYGGNSVKRRSPVPFPQNDLPIQTHRRKLNCDLQEAKNGPRPMPLDGGHASPKAANSDPVVYVKEEVDDTSVEAKQVHVTTSGRNRGSGKSREPKYECQVCGDVAAGYHCGAYVCEACKKFYLRCLKTRGAPAFLCPKNNDCDITKDSRSHCQFCRFQKCISLGMYRAGQEDDRKLKINFKIIPCKVCNAPSSGFHFGAITCEGCKGFFRRMLKEQLHKKFICVNDEPCNIDSANRTTCKCCRFEKCLKVGMTLDGTRLGRQSNSVKRRTLMQYIANDEPDLQNDFQQYHGSASKDAANSPTVGNSGSTSGILEENEDSSEPLCINFPSDRLSRKRSSSNSLDNSVPECAAPRLEAWSFGSGEYAAENEADFLHYRADGRDRLSPQLKTGFNEEIQNHGYFPLDKRKLFSNDDYRNSRENPHSFRSAADETSTSFYSRSKGMSNLAGRDLPYSTRNIDRLPALLGHAPQKVFGHYGDWNGSDREQQLCTEQPRNITSKAVSLKSGANIGSCSDEGSYALPAAKKRNVTEVLESGEYQSLERQALESWQHAPNSEGSLAANDRLKVCLLPCGDTPTETVARPISAECNILTVFESPEILFGHLVSAFRELEDINLRPPDMDELHYQPVSIQTIWKLVEIPFIHQSKIILKFIKKVPGFRLLAVEDQIKIAQDSLYPIVLLYHSRSYDVETEEFSWFICSPKERDLVLSVLTPFRSLTNHFRSIGHIIKRLSMTEEELAFIAAMSVLTASEGSPLKSGNKVAELQDAVVEAFVSYQQRDCGGNPSQKRMGELLARLPELKRANIEHRLIIAQVEQMIPEIEMSNLYREIFLSG